jgi:pimeloyl-ACP methyl ester carboxylesterase
MLQRRGSRNDVLRSVLASAVAMMLVLASGCSLLQKRSDDGAPTPPVVRAPIAISEQALAHRGEIFRVINDANYAPPLVDAAGSIVRAIYRSTSGVTGSATFVTGFFAVPKGAPPPGGWAVVSFAHGTTGIDHGCGPSGKPDLMGYEDTVATILNSGYAVAMTDYQGLDDLGLHPLQETGHHPFLEPYTAAYNVIDAVRAIRQLFPQTSTKWAGAGGSQGGQAVWAANEFSPDYGQGLDLLGSVALAPNANITPLAYLAANRKLSADQLGVMPLVIVGLQRAGLLPEGSAYLRGDVAKYRTEILGCQPDSAVARSKVHSDDVNPDTEAATAALRQALQSIALPQRRLAAPLLVINGKRDELISPSWVSYAIKQSCDTGGKVQHVEYLDAGHLIVLNDDTALKWLKKRLAGDAPESNCGAAPLVKAD